MDFYASTDPLNGDLREWIWGIVNSFFTCLIRWRPIITALHDNEWHPGEVDSKKKEKVKWIISSFQSKSIIIYFSLSSSWEWEWFLSSVGFIHRLQIQSQHRSGTTLDYWQAYSLSICCLIVFCHFVWFLYETKPNTRLQCRTTLYTVHWLTDLTGHWFDCSAIKNSTLSLSMCVCL